jgi:hypothetical protein
MDLLSWRRRLSIVFSWIISWLWGVLGVWWRRECSGVWIVGLRLVVWGGEVLLRRHWGIGARRVFLAFVILISGVLGFVL